MPLGDDNELPPSTARLCFNCGSPDHAVASCSEPIDRRLVSLSRQLFNFLHPDPITQETTRFYEAEGWKQQRLLWLESYEPGVIRTPLLRDALGLPDGDPGTTVGWLPNMAYWGYPPGWFGCQDPKQLVCSRILECDPKEHATDTESDPFMIFDGTDDDEEIDLRLFTSRCPTSTPPVTSLPTLPVDVEWTRWATYPNTYFSSTGLSIYNGMPLNRVAPSHSRVSVTFTPERMALWERILSDGLGTQSTPPWRRPGAFGTSSAGEGVVSGFVPPPPSTTPPPFPNPPLQPSAKKNYSMEISDPPSAVELNEIVEAVDDRSIIDMDISNDSE